MFIKKPDQGNPVIWLPGYLAKTRGFSSLPVSAGIVILNIFVIRECITGSNI